MKLSSLKQQIEELDAKAQSKYLDEQLSAMRKLSDTWCNEGPELLRRLLVAEEAFGNILKMTAGHYGIDKTATSALKTIRGEEE